MQKKVNYWSSFLSTNSLPKFLQKSIKFKNKHYFCNIVWASKSLNALVLIEFNVAAAI